NLLARRRRDTASTRATAKSRSATERCEHLFRTRCLAGAKLVRRPSQRLVKTGTVCVVKVVALVCWDKVDFRPVRQVDGLVEEKSSAPHPRLEGQRHGVSLGSLRASRKLAAPPS